MKPGEPNFKEWGQWRGARYRCHNPNSKDYKNYGARGIEMCASWRSSFNAFLLDMGKCPPGMTLDRVNTNGPYDKNNCRWATPSTQQRNKTTSYRLVVKGVEFETITDAAAHFSVSLTTINRWCDGYSDARRPHLQARNPRPDCRKERLYP